MRQEEQILEAFWSKEEQARKHCHVATSPRRDVTKSRRGGQLLQKSTRPHVATPPRRDVTTSRRHHVATSAKKFCISSLNARRLGNLGDWSLCGQRHEIEDLQTLTGGFFLYFCIRFSLFTWLFLDYMMVFLILCILFLYFMMF